MRGCLIIADLAVGRERHAGMSRALSMDSQDGRL
jgi:hypothetical protein